MAKQLTAVSVANARPGQQRREIPDAGCRGLYLIVQPSGRKSWAVRYRFAGEIRGKAEIAEANAVRGP